MKAQAKRAWIKALRSGEYEQTQGKLCDAEGAMCCLGVLIDVTQDGEWRLRDSDDGGFYAYDGKVGLLSDAVKEDVGLGAKTEARLVALNDDDGRSFADIADWVEVNA
jgi:hypothetical protein